MFYPEKQRVDSCILSKFRLSKLFDHWRGRDHVARYAGRDALRRLGDYLRPDLDAAPPLHRQVEDAARRIARFTDDQMRMADVAEANPRVLCSGGAGTGKTFLAEHLAQRWADEGMHVAVVCRSPWLRHFLASRLSMPGLVVSLHYVAMSRARSVLSLILRGRA